MYKTLSKLQFNKICFNLTIKSKYLLEFTSRSDSLATDKRGKKIFSHLQAIYGWQALISKLPDELKKMVKNKFYDS